MPTHGVPVLQQRQRIAERSTLRTRQGKPLLSGQSSRPLNSDSREGQTLRLEVLGHRLSVVAGKGFELG